MGRPAKPILLRKVEGNPGKRKLTDKVEFNGSFGVPPGWMGDVAKYLWASLAPELEAKGLSAEVYRPALEGLCANYERAVDAEKSLKETGMSFETAKGYIGQRPEVAIVMKSWALVCKFCVEFGFTPSASSRIVSPPAPGKSLRELIQGS